MTDILKNVLNIAARIHDMQAAGTLAMAFFGIVLVFGLVNCILGYRLLRFWMMIFGFLMGAGAGFFGSQRQNHLCGGYADRRRSPCGNILCHL